MSTSRSAAALLAATALATSGCALMRVSYSTTEATDTAEHQLVEAPGPAVPLIAVTEEPLAAEVFGLLHGVDARQGVITFDPATWLTGEDAVVEARRVRAIGPDETDVPNGYFIANDDGGSQGFTLAQGVEITVMTSPGDPSTEQRIDAQQLEDWLGQFQGIAPPFWLTLDVDGHVDGLRFVYTP